MASIIISLCALGFTILSFWWLQARRGRSFVGPPRSYMAIGSKEETLILRLPLVFFNDGPMPIFVRNLRVIILEETTRVPLILTATLPVLDTKEGRQLATQFAVNGRTTLQGAYEFHRKPGKMEFEARDYRLELQGRYGPRPRWQFWKKENRWQPLCQFLLHVGADDLKTIKQHFVVHDNPAEW